MAETVVFQAEGGGEARGAMALPAGDQKAPTLVLLQEWWGVNDHIRSLVDRMAAAGFIVLAPDLYDGKVTRDPTEAQGLMTALKWPTALKVIAGAKALLDAHPRSNGHIGVVGFCMGGAGALVTACNLSGFGAAAPFYGTPPDAAVDWSKLTCPVLAHVATRDQWVTVARATEIQQKVRAAGGTMDVAVYEADHAFVNDTRPEVYSPENATLAWDRTVAFFHQHLG